MIQPDPFHDDTPKVRNTSCIVRCCVGVHGRPGERYDVCKMSFSCVRSTRSATRDGASYVDIRTRLWSIYMLRLVCLNSASPPTSSTMRSSTTAVSHAYSRCEYTIAWYNTKWVEGVPSARRAFTEDGCTAAGWLLVRVRICWVFSSTCKSLGYMAVTSARVTTGTL